VCCEYHAVEEVLWLKGEGLLTPQQCFFRLTARPGAFDVNRKQALADPATTGQALADPATTGQAALQRLRYGCYHAGLSDKVKEMLPFYRFRMILLWLKSPSP
jgi:hypothetical protein